MKPVARRHDPSTSWDAARSVSGVTETQQRIIELLDRHGPMSDDQIATAHRNRYPGILVTSSGLRTRRSELASMGLVVDTGRRVRMESGRYAIVWRSKETIPDHPTLFDRSMPPEAAGPEDLEPVYEEPPE